MYRHISLPAGVGWDSWIRTSGCRSQSPVPYHLAIPQYESKRKSRKRLLPRCRHAEKRAPVGSHHYILLGFRLLLVPGKGFEPSHRMTLDPKTSASASFAIRAQIENPPVRGLGVSGGIRTHMPFDTSPSSWSVCHFATDTYWRCRCDSNACAGFHRPGRLATCSRHHLGTTPYDRVPRFVHRDIRYRPAAPKQAAAAMKAAFCVVRPKGFEPPTHGLKVRCSPN